MTRYVALLRGINVGGNNLIKMADLKACFEEHGFADASTYIASGNVLFASDVSSRALTGRIEKMLSQRFSYPASVVLRSQKQMKETVVGAPKGFGASPDEFRYDVIFLKEPLTAAKTLQDVPTREGVDEVHAGKGALYFSRLISKAAQSKLTRVIGMPIYKSMTIRNWNTTTKLLQLMEQ
jgi:uncharacterized protein (DUF1697 family)